MAKKTKIDVVGVTCKCGQGLGAFAPMDDHSGILIRCPKCQEMVAIYNALLTDFIDNPEDFAFPNHDNGVTYHQPVEVEAVVPDGWS